MKPTSISTRSVIFCFLVGPPRVLTRKEGMEVHDSVCRKLGSDEFSFQFNSSDAEPPNTGKAFAIVLDRKEARGVFRILIDGHGAQAPVRLFVESPWPKSRDAAFEDVDLAIEAVSDALAGGWERVLAETRIRCQVEAKGDSAAAFMAREMLHLSNNELEALRAPLSFVGIRYETPAGHTTEGDQLANPKREVTVEVLREDPRCLYLEMMSQWPQLPAPPGQPGTMPLDARMIRTFTHSPSEYLQESVAYLNAVVLPMFSR